MVIYSVNLPFSYISKVLWWTWWAWMPLRYTELTSVLMETDWDDLCVGKWA